MSVPTCRSCVLRAQTEQRPNPSRAASRAIPRPVGGAYGSPCTAGGQGESGTPGHGALASTSTGLAKFPGADNLTVWVSGERGSEVCELFGATRIAGRRVGDAVGQASALKICAGLRSKVIPAIWATLIEAASHAGPEVEHAVRAQLSDIGYDLDREAVRVAERAPKAWRWIGEMEESAKAMRELGLPAGFSEAAAEAYARIAGRQL